MLHYELYLPFPPTVNNYYVKTKRGVFISSKGKLFRQQAAESVLQQLGDPPVITERMLVEVVLYPPDMRKRDLDNYMKALLDSLTCCNLWEDDSLVDQLFNYRGAKTPGGQVFMRITPAGPVLPVGCVPPEV